MASRKIIRRLVLAAAISAPVSMLPPAHAGVFLAVNIAPPALPVYTQPPCPGEGFLWTPGYWAYGPEGYFWVPGTWVRPPRVGYLWTPAYWGWEGSGYIFHSGYWGPHVGFYGGINYGFGYGGYGYEGGYWHGNTFAYNRAVNNININLVHNVYERPVPLLNGAYNHVSYNGGNGGVPYRASQQELFAAQREQHLRPTSEQLQHQSFAAQDRQQFAAYNHGRPAITAAPFPGALRSNQLSPGQNFGNLNGPRSAYANPATRPQPYAPRPNTPETYRNGFGSPRQQPQYQQRQPQYQERQPQYQQRQPQFQQRQPQYQQRQAPQYQQRQQPQPRPSFQPRAPQPAARPNPGNPGAGHGRH